jgi:hypothetical protein
MNTLWYTRDIIPNYNEMLINSLKKYNNTIFLYQNDFINGTYRITKPGVYILKEDIVFHPNPDNDFNPTVQQLKEKVFPSNPFRLGFFAAITIECNNVIIDLNGYTLSQSTIHNSKQRFFALIELANSPFIPNTGPANFGKDIQTALNVIIKNGTLGLSSHHGIHGNNNHRILIQNIIFKDFEVAAISLNGGKYIYINNCTIKGNNTNIPSNAMLSQSIFAIPFLKTIKDNNPDAYLQTKLGKKTIQQILTTIQEEIDSFFNSMPYEGLFGNPSGLLDGNCYGIVLNSSGPVIGAFKDFSPTNDTNCFVVIENTTIENIISSGMEIGGYGTNENDSNGSYGKDQLVGPLGDIIQFDNAIDDDGFYVGNMVTDMQLIINKYGKSKQELGSSNVPESMIHSIEACNKTIHEILLEKGYYIIPNRDAMGHHMKGNAGIFISQGSYVMIKDNTINDIVNDGTGNNPSCESSGVLLSGTNHISILNTKIDNIVSSKGDAEMVRYKLKNNNIIIIK